MNWIINLSVSLIAVAFIVLVIFLIYTLLSLRETVKKTNAICADVEEKLHACDPYFHVASKIGEKVERGISRKLVEQEDESACKDQTIQVALEVAEWAIIGLTLWKKIKERRS